LSSGNEADLSGSPESLLEAASRWSGAALAIIVAGGSFRLETIDLLTRRVLLLQAGPALVGMRLVVRLVWWRRRGSRSARRYHRTCKAARPGTIEIRCDYRRPSSVMEDVSHVAGW
jgi:hypothetical protein